MYLFSFLLRTINWIISNNFEYNYNQGKAFPLYVSVFPFRCLFAAWPFAPQRSIPEMCWLAHQQVQLANPICRVPFNKLFIRNGISLWHPLRFLNDCSPHFSSPAPLETTELVSGAVSNRFCCGNTSCALFDILMLLIPSKQQYEVCLRLKFYSRKSQIMNWINFEASYARQRGVNDAVLSILLLWITF